MTQRLDYAGVAPAGMKAFDGVHRYVADSGLGGPLVDLVYLRVSQINGCAYCVDLHSTDALKADVSPRRLAALPVWRETPFFSDRERAALAWTESLTLVSENHVPDAVWEQIRPHFTPEEVVALTLLVATINAWNRLASAFRKLPN